MATVFDAAEYILRRHGEMSAMKLQKLVYYSQAWSLVWDDAPLFDEPIEAWVFGPVCPALYKKHKGHFSVRQGMFGGDPDALTENQRDTVNRVCDAYINLNAQQLSDMTHAEDPWKNARTGLNAADHGSEVISLESMMEYYSSLSADE